MMAMHEVLVTMQISSGEWVREGNEIDYDGPADWKLQPIEPEARAKWEAEIAQPERVSIEQCRMSNATRFPATREGSLVASENWRGSNQGGC